MEVKDYLSKMLDRGASDLYLKIGTPPYFRIDNKLLPAIDKRLKSEDIEAVLKSILTDAQRRHFDITKELDAAYSLAGVGRFRFNVYMQRNSISITFRSVKMNIPSFDELNLPKEIMQDLAKQPRGLILITGYAGSGKSTTLASIIDYMNEHFEKHIITIEDPIEFLHSDKKSILSQREVGSDTLSFDHALRHVIRQSPDAILIGELRDVATMQTAIMAAETGHLVLSTLHTVDAAQTIDRVINFFPPHAHSQIRMQLSLLLKGVVSQRLVPRVDGAGRVPACEVMLSTPTVRKMLSEGKTEQLTRIIEEGRLFGMQTFNQSLTDWLNKKVISKESALYYASNADELALQLKDIHSGRGEEF
ncbi:MAG: PilT/PilU family type 4a pilus ATPase [Candidatus Omnitrophota bacterium]